MSSNIIFFSHLLSGIKVCLLRKGSIKTCYPLVRVDIMQQL
ncbi:hypothetical protein HanIR_Chr08g0366261 [Helianthus annuus]|nr:hypothetical protein HanIR_Chr08g0366261 [Helianthus annuus]